MNTVPELPVGKKILLPQRGSWPESVHVFDESSVWALRAALAAQRPLLVRGEPGVGKSQLARGAAEAWGRMFVAEVVHARSESQDLQWRYDAVGRLGDAQALGASRLEPDQVRQQLDHSRYLSPGALWWVFDWEGALNQHKRGGGQVGRPEEPKGWTVKKGSVLLIDEIDKAEADLPNGLLETLGNGAFSVPWLGEPVKARADVPTPLVVITTNEEREMPAAFVRRCLVLNLQLPDKREAFIELMVKRGRMHFQDKCHDDAYQEAARQLWDDRDASQADAVRPGQAEYIDMLRVLATLEPNREKQVALLAKVGVFALKKQPPPRA